MLAIVLKILSILGIVLLTLLCVLLTVLFLVLFFPIRYRLTGQKNAEEMNLCARASWLFGLLRVQFAFPEPAKPVIKILCFRLKGKNADETEQKQEKSQTKRKSKKKSASESPAEDIHKEQPISTHEIPPENATEAVTDAKDSSNAISQDQNPEAVNPEAAGESVPPQAQPEDQESASAEAKTIFERISAKYDKIKYTIQKLCDRIKHIWENITFYKDLITEENTRELFRHACVRLGKVLKSIRPRKLKADVRFGAASPDTTGYLYGMYCILSPKLGKDICVIPDFDQALLEGEFYAAGKITLFKILINGLLLLLDKRLRKFFRRVKMHRAVQQ